MTKVVLVAAPYLSLPRPALGVSLLQAALRERGIDCTVRYLNLDYADFEDPDFGQAFCQSGHQPLGEWIFSHLVNGRDKSLPQDRGWAWVKSCVKGAFAERMMAAKRRAGDFVELSAQAILQAAPDHVGFTTSFQQNCASLSIASRLKLERPELVISFGGANCFGPMGHALLSAFPQIDFVFSGEADEHFPAFVEGLANGEAGGGRYIDCEPVTDVDALPVPAFDDYFSQLDRTGFKDRIVPSLPFESSRGCWWRAKHHCVFCGLNGENMGFRAKSPERVIKEVRLLREAWNVPRFCASDSIMDMRHIDSIFARWPEELSKTGFLYEIKSNLTVEQLRTIAAAGVMSVQPGIESLDDDLLRLMSKGVRALQNILLLRTAREIGMRVYWTMLAGFPQETPEHYAKMAAMFPKLQHFEPPSGLRQLRIDRFSPYHNDPRQFGYSAIAPLPGYREIYDLPPETIENMVTFFEGTRALGPFPDGYLDAAEHEIRSWRQRAYDGAPARLSLVRLGPLKMICDTRDCAVESEYILAPAAEQVLHAFDRPSSVERRMAELGRCLNSERSPESWFSELVDLGYLVVD
ncbi:MAG: RiPP maturation radical SAM C-methyltransferase, partial [Alphaproteobacteria bacterium]|nr:RiPP maturation radical SAM C-methyltransferase [Alphaproteobacteria bacterium]